MNTCRPKHEWGTFLWGFLHTISIIDFEDNTDFARECLKQLDAVQSIIPCHSCAEHYRDQLRLLSAVDLGERLALFKWTCDLHNQVNLRLGKPTWSYEQALMCWTRRIDGPKTGAM